MFNVDSCQYKLFEVLPDKQEVFVGSGFIIRGNKSTRLVTAAHVATKKLGEPRLLIAKSYTEVTVLNNLAFVCREHQDVAEAIVDDGLNALTFGPETYILNGSSLKIRPVYLRHPNNPESILSVTNVGGVELSRRGSKPINPKYENSFDYIGNTNQAAWPGCSGSPILNQINQVVVIHVRGIWDNGKRLNTAMIYTQETENR